MFGKLISVSGDTVKLKLDDDIDLSKLIRFANGQQPVVEVRIDDGRHITPDQRKKIYALLGDYCLYTGYRPADAKGFFKSMVTDYFNIEPFSLSNCSETVASNMITTMLEFFFFEDIPFRTKIWDSLPNDFPRVIMCLRYRRCAICLRANADIDHVTTVGIGRNRNKINHTGMYIEPLCRIHHTIRHTMGIESFMQRYHLKPVKVTPDIARELHLGRMTRDDKQSSFNRAIN